MPQACYTRPVDREKISMMNNDDMNSGGAVLKVIGVGGGGGNAIGDMIAEGVGGVEFICANTDLQALQKSQAGTIIQLGEEITKGLGAGADPEMGKQAAQEARQRIIKILRGTDMVFITAGMGGGTGTGAAPVFAEIAKELGILTVAVVTKPFSFEGKKRMLVAQEGIKELGKSVDSLITIPNDKLLSVLGKSVSLLSAFKAANAVLLGAVQGIADLITRPGLINVDFADVRTVMLEMGMAMMGSASAQGEHRAEEAALAAVKSPLLEDVDLSGAHGVLVNITAGPDMSIGEFETVGETIRSNTSSNATVVVGAVIDPDAGSLLKVTVVLTGLGSINGGSDEVPVQEAERDCGTNTQQTVAQGENRELELETVDYQEFSRPAVMRRMSDERVSETDTTAADVDKEIRYLDIPAFLRRQEEEEV